MRQAFFFSLTEYGNILPNETQTSFIGSEELDWFCNQYDYLYYLDVRSGLNDFSWSLY